MSLILRYFTVFIILSLNLFSGHKVIKVDFLKGMELKINGAGPLLIKTDPVRSYTYLANTNTSSVTLINGKSGKITNIAIKKRVPQYLKDSAMQINRSNGNLYLIGKKSLNIIFPENKKAIYFDTEDQYEMVAVNTENGDAYLSGVESKFIGYINFKNRSFKKIPWLINSFKKVNLNQTPPPPIRKIFVDHILKRVFAIDGEKSEIFKFTMKGKLLKKRKIICRGGDRWHFAGQDNKKHFLYLMLENKKREATEAIRIDLNKEIEKSIILPKKREGVGLSLNPEREEIYIPYDNHPLVHIVSFKGRGRIYDVSLPAYGNDASVVDVERELLFVSSWAKGDLSIIDLKKRKMVKRVGDLGIIPHMFSMSLDQKRNKLYIPIGASAVNGSFGSSVMELDLYTFNKKKIYTGWAPIVIIPKKNDNGVIVFNSEDMYAEVQPDGTYLLKKLSVSFINNAVIGKNGNIYVSYGPHQSYWPSVYIWGAKNGIITIKKDGSGLYDRRIPRMAQAMALDLEDRLFLLQNNWGKEKQYLTVLENEVIDFNPSNRIVLPDEVVRETTQRILKFDPDMNWLYIVRVGEKDEDPGVFQIVDLRTKKILHSFFTGLTPFDLNFDRNFIYISNFDSGTVTKINKFNFKKEIIKTFKTPTVLERNINSIFLLSHLENKICKLSDKIEYTAIPFPGKPSMIKKSRQGLIITSHTKDTLRIILFNPETAKFSLIHKESYPFMDTTVATNNSAFYVRGQFADGIFSINRIFEDKNGRIWISDYLSGKLFILSPN